jgi:hypothetical protein
LPPPAHGLTLHGLNRFYDPHLNKLRQRRVTINPISVSFRLKLWPECGARK